MNLDPLIFAPHTLKKINIFFTKILKFSPKLNFYHTNKGTLYSRLSRTSFIPNHQSFLRERTLS